MERPRLRGSHGKWLAGGIGRCIFWDSKTGKLCNGSAHHSGGMTMILCNQDILECNKDAAILMNLYLYRIEAVMEDASIES